MIPLITLMLVSGCLSAPSPNSTTSSSTSSSSSSSSSLSSNGQSISSLVSSSSTGGDGVSYTITKQFSSGTPNISSLSKVSLSQTSLPSLGSSILATDQKIASMRDQTNQMIAAMQKQNQVQFSAANNMANSIQQAVKASHAAIQTSLKTMFKPFSVFSSSPFFI